MTINAEFIDKQKIRELISNWAFWRDQEKWDKLENCFHSEGTISVTWYSGHYKEFIEKSMKMGRTSHKIGNSRIELCGNRAISECNAEINGRARKLIEIDLTACLRFLDFLEKVDGNWRIVKRYGIYEKDRLDLVKPSLLGSIILRSINCKSYPQGCKYLCYVLGKKGYEINSDIISSETAEEEELLKAADKWVSCQ